MTDHNRTPLDQFNELEQDALKEIGNISLGSAATILSQLTSRRVTITTPSISYNSVEEINDRCQAPCVLVEVEYVEGILGNNLLIVDTRDAVIIGQLMMMEQPDPEAEINDIHLSALSEAMNMMMGAAATALSDIFQKLINISTPKVAYKKVNEKINEHTFLNGVQGFIQVAFRIEVEDLIDSELLQLIPLDFSREMVDFLIAKMGGAPEVPVELPELPELPPPEEQLITGPEAVVDSIEPVAGALQPDCSEVTEDVLDDEFALVKNIQLEVKCVAGRVRMPLEKLLRLGVGSVVELDSQVGQDVEVLINGKPVMYGEIVAVGNHFGLRLTKPLSKLRRG